MYFNLKRKKKGKVLFSFCKKIEMELEIFKWCKWLGYLNFFKVLFVVEIEGGFLEKENSVIK